MESDGIAAFGDVRLTTASHRFAEGAKESGDSADSVTALQALADDGGLPDRAPAFGVRRWSRAVVTWGHTSKVDNSRCTRPTNPRKRGSCTRCRALPLTAAPTVG
jgi:hypothetical protein